MIRAIARLFSEPVFAVGWVVVVVAGGVARFPWLGSPPLTPEEGARAFEAWSLARTWSVEYAAGPTLTNALSVVFALFGDSDLTARVLAASCGMVLVLAALLLRPVIGHAAAVGAALALASSPLLILASRSVSPTIGVVLATLVVVIAAVRSSDGASQRWVSVGLAAAIVGVTLDSSMVLVLLVLALSAAIAEGDAFARTVASPAFRQRMQHATPITLIVAVALATRLLTVPGGFQAGLIDPWWRWLGDFNRGGGFTGPTLMLVLEGALLAAAGLSFALHRPVSRFTRFLGVWMVIAILSNSIVRQPDVRYLTFATLPASLLAGLGIGRLLEIVVPTVSGRAVAVAALFLAPVVSAAFYTNTSIHSNQSPWAAAPVILIAGSAIVAVLAVNWLPLRQVGLCAAAAGTVLLLGWNASVASRLFDARGSARGHVLEGSVNSPELEWVRSEARRWMFLYPGATVIVDPSVMRSARWALRDVPTVTPASVGGDASLGRLIPAGAPNIPPGASARRVVIGFESDAASLRLTPDRLWRWYFGRQSLTDVRPYAIVVGQPSGT
jgi:hypothetical protein